MSHAWLDLADNRSLPAPCPLRLCRHGLRNRGHGRPCRVADKAVWLRVETQWRFRQDHEPRGLAPAMRGYASNWACHRSVLHRIQPLAYPEKLPPTVLPIVCGRQGGRQASPKWHSHKCCAPEECRYDQQYHRDLAHSLCWSHRKRGCFRIRPKSQAAQ